MVFHITRFIIYLLVTKRGKVPDLCFGILSKLRWFSNIFPNGWCSREYVCLQFCVCLHKCKPQTNAMVINTQCFGRLFQNQWTRYNHTNRAQVILENRYQNEFTHKFLSKMYWHSSFFVLVILLLLLNYDLEHMLKYGIISGFLFYTWLIYVVPCTYQTVKYFLIVCFNCKYRVIELNKMGEQIAKQPFLRYTSLWKLLDSYNKIFNLIEIYNKFWKKNLFIVVYGLTPFNLILLHQLVFEALPNYVLICVGFAFTFATAFLFLLNSITASVFKEVKRSEQIIFDLMTKFYTNSNIKRKFKVIFKT